MIEAAYFIEGRALSLAYEGTRFPEIAPAALAWLHMAMAWAKRHGMYCLEKKLSDAVQRIESARVPA